MEKRIQRDKDQINGVKQQRRVLRQKKYRDKVAWRQKAIGNGKGKSEKGVQTTDNGTKDNGKRTWVRRTEQEAINNDG